ncbi:MAG: hypothetical protein N3D74_06680, partial [Caldisericia bacterium]|nr:hypothetical protein [Caldisericia bacterium]
ATNNQTISSDWFFDDIERTALIIDYKSNSINFKLFGSNDKVNAIELKSFTLNNPNGSVKQDFIVEPYKFYKVQLTGSYEYVRVYLIEANYYKAQVYKAIEILIRGLSTTQSDSWFEKAEYYAKSYANELETMLLTYDNDDDGIPDTKENTSIKSIELLR